MANKAPHSATGAPLRLFQAFGLLTLGSLLAALALREWLLLGLPFVLLLAFQTLVDYRPVFWLLLASVPFSIAFQVGSFATDLPSEPLAVGLMLAYGLALLQRLPQQSLAFFAHPISLLLAAQFVWMLFCVLHTHDVLVSVKFVLAKSWYLVAYFYLAGKILHDERQARRLLWVAGLPLTLAVLYALLRHAATGFSFTEVNDVMHPFFRNHVMYAAIMTLFVPYFWFGLWEQRRGTWRWWLLLACLAILMLAIQTSYTRAAYVALLLAGGVYVLLRWRLLRWALLAGLVVAALGVVWLLHQKQYLEFAPNYERTISHYEFDNLVEATYKLEDISTMERVYRWVAGYHMSRAEPWTGFGPGNFYGFYRHYTLSSFETYVSDNPEKSGIHSYFLMLLVEQGWPALLLFLALVVLVFWYGESIYHHCPTPARRRMVLAPLLSLVIIHAFLLINDLVETDKVGAFYFVALALLINADRLNKGAAGG